MTDPVVRRRFASWLRERLFLRFHISLILLATFLSGFAASTALRACGVTVLPFRYALAVSVAYLAFFLWVRLWIAYATADDGPLEAASDTLDALDVADSLTSPLRQSPPVDHGHDWHFSTGDASADSAGGSSTGLADALGSADDLGLVLAFLAVALAVVVALAYMLWAGPAILTEAALSALLAGSLARRARRLERPDWAAGVLRSTVLPFLAVFATTVAFGWIAAAHCPDADRFRDILTCTQP